MHGYSAYGVSPTLPLGCPETPWNSQGGPLRQGLAGFTHELYKLLGIKLATSTAYHPQTEHANQELEGYLHIFTSQ
jgi:hypothetical protein